MSHAFRFAPVTALLALVALAARAGAQCAGELQEILAADGEPSDELGWSIDQSAQLAVVGAWRSDELANLAGSAYVLRRGASGWSVEQVLVADDGALADFFGWSVAIGGYTIAVGSVSDADAAPDGGAVYVYAFDGVAWQPQAELFASDAAEGDHFGVSVALDGDTMLVGADLKGDAGTWSGAVYVLERMGGAWVETQKLVPSSHAAYDHFGYAVALDGDLAVVGAYGSDAFAGAAFVFRESGSGWVEEARVVGSETAAGDFFGAAVAVDGARVLSGARWADVAGKLDAGEAYVFAQQDGVWTEEARLTDAAPASGDGFGFAVDLSGDLALVGEHRRGTAAGIPGAAVLFHRAGGAWLREPRLFASDAADEDMFGLAVSIESSSILIGAPWHDHQAEDAGAVYAFDASACVPCPPPQPYCTGAPNSAGAGSRIGWSGSTSIAAADLVLRASGNPPLQPALFFYGTSRQQTPFGNGVLCVGGALTRFPVLQIDAQGEAAQPVDYDAPRHQHVDAGETFHFQLWYRDPMGGGAAFNLSDALSITFCE